MKIIIQHPERRTTQVIVVSSSAGVVTVIQPAQCLEFELPPGETVALYFAEPSNIELPAPANVPPEGVPDDLTPEDEERLADEFADFERDSD